MFFLLFLVLNYKQIIILKNHEKNNCFFNYFFINN